MRYDIRLVIDYTYPGASDHVRNLLRLLPHDSPDQHVEARRLSITPPPDERREGTDFFGNITTHVAWHRPVARTRYLVEARVRRHAVPAAQGLDLSPPLPLLEGQMQGRGLGPGAPAHFRAPSARIVASARIAAFAQDATSGAATTLAALEALGEAVHEVMHFDPSATDAATPPEVSFAARRGVCQDFAQIMIAGLRALGVPAGYVSGFLRTKPPPGAPRLQGVDAMHGWVSAWCGREMGWVDYDPTNRCRVGADHVTVARGRDYGCAAPVHGSIRTAGGQQSRHAVDMTEIAASP